MGGPRDRDPRDGIRVSELAPQGRHYASEAIEVWYDVRRCRHAAECVRGDAAVFDTSRKPWIQPALGDPEHIADVIRRCPTGALHYRLTDGPEELADAPTVIQALPTGAIVVRGALLLETEDGLMAERRAMLCGCAQSTNRPFCDGRCERAAPPAG